MEKLGGLRHIFVTVFLSSFAAVMVLPSITDVTMSALCPGKIECSLAIYLTGFQQAVIGLGTVVVMPLIGNLSDLYGRKALLTLPMTVCIIPLAILACGRTRNFFYIYFVLRTLTGMISDGSVLFLALAYVADNFSERRATAIGVLSGIGSGAFVCGTLTARFLSLERTFQVAAVVSMIAVVYMRVFLKDTSDSHALTQPILRNDPETIQSDHDKSSRRSVKVFKKIALPKDIMCMLKSSVTFSQAAFVAFFNSLAEGGVQASLLFFLKDRFHYNKDQFADALLIFGVAGTVSQLLFMPMLAPILGEEKLLSIGLLVGFSNMLLNSIAWSDWVPYVIAVFNIFASFATPCLRSIVSKQVGLDEQGMAQGCISGMSSFASIISPLIFSPLTALFLSEKAPFNFPGFSILCIGLAWMIAFVQSIMMKAPPTISNNVRDNNSTEA